ncbi:hypothetical protein K5V21_12590 [Clostridium sardiniense]|uniref:Uncharacterized protein n=1 Tax=Clostridium sardiniense TaxID=29369 RepID=A0ABS7KZP6_CLOSR|nr:hypothetical protein [Clostridium sardiniense]MBY0756285.1 hypothetical protein [Clostridium sardiniense]MDQ0458500.1 hypothetical protein [Clostridium sardiniense]
MFDGLALVLEIVRDTEIKAYTLDTKETTILNGAKGYIVGLSDLFEREESVIVQYDIENKIISKKEILEDYEIEEFRQ